MKLSGLARSTYYYYLKQQGTDKYCVVKQEIEKIFTENKQRYGYRRILLVLRQQGIKLNHKTVHKLMRSMGLHGKRRKSKYKSYKGEVGKVAANILSRDFAADKPFEKLATDVTEFAVCDDKVYLSPIIDLHNKEVISYSISTSPNFLANARNAARIVRQVTARRKTDLAFRSRLAIPNERVSKATERT